MHFKTSHCLLGSAGIQGEVGCSGVSFLTQDSPASNTPMPFQGLPRTLVSEEQRHSMASYKSRARGKTETPPKKLCQPERWTNVTVHSLLLAFQFPYLRRLLKGQHFHFLCLLPSTPGLALTPPRIYRPPGWISPHGEPVLNPVPDMRGPLLHILTFPGTVCLHPISPESLTYDREPGPRAEGIVKVGTSKYSHSKMDTWDPLFPVGELKIYLRDILPTTVSFVPPPKKTSVFAQ